jgi:hypothetical protein
VRHRNQRSVLADEPVVVYANLFHHSNADAAVRREVCVDPAVAIAIAAGWVLGGTPRSRLQTTRVAVAGVAG